ncbi:uncharacterized protein B0I36DRAFT_393012 [Microdochium trichocladiopsis]|uniref:Uncharacterized protein n=1 Tax=Microdochium trichocladiopsis TaxID=1682393 RepID=A0A9P9BHR4_9PEZI|nr:uncharacterized protein B0I36DRAFT_393012 [Microdochium trichocladiopsis]KAH7020815.1 hypothetical protein B0I36DRAFT_393012 [Microdochium trichocladiopsis]
MPSKGSSHKFKHSATGSRPQDRADYSDKNSKRQDRAARWPDVATSSAASSSTVHARGHVPGLGAFQQRSTTGVPGQHQPGPAAGHELSEGGKTATADDSETVTLKLLTADRIVEGGGIKVPATHPYFLYHTIYRYFPTSNVRDERGLETCMNGRSRYGNTDSLDQRPRAGNVDHRGGEPAFQGPGKRGL